MSDAPPPGYWCDLTTGKEWRATKAELREVARLLAVHRDIARAGTTHERSYTREPIPLDASRFLAGLGIDVASVVKGDVA